MLSALEASATADCLSASRLSPEYVPLPSEVLAMNGLTTFGFPLVVTLQAGRCTACRSTPPLLKELSSLETTMQEIATPTSVYQQECRLLIKLMTTDYS